MAKATNQAMPHWDVSSSFISSVILFKDTRLSAFLDTKSNLYGHMLCISTSFQVLAPPEMWSKCSFCVFLNISLIFCLKRRKNMCTEKTVEISVFSVGSQLPKGHPNGFPYFNLFMKNKFYSIQFKLHQLHSMTTSLIITHKVLATKPRRDMS